MYDAGIAKLVYKFGLKIGEIIACICVYAGQSLVGFSSVIESTYLFYCRSLFNSNCNMERCIQKWVLWILFYNIKLKSIYLPEY